MKFAKQLSALSFRKKLNSIFSTYYYIFDKYNYIFTIHLKLINF